MDPILTVLLKFILAKFES